MKNRKPETENNRENFARTSEEVPFFPLRPVSMTHGDMDPIEQLQFDFMQQAGRPAGPSEDDSAEEK